MSSDKTENLLEIKPCVEQKTSMEILSELFGTFDAEPPVIVKQEKDDDLKKQHKKSRKKHKHKDKKSRKKDKKSKKKRKLSEESSSSENDAIDLSDILIQGDIGGSFAFTQTIQRIIKSEIKEEIIEDNTLGQSGIVSNIVKVEPIDKIKVEKEEDTVTNKIQNEDKIINDKLTEDAKNTKHTSQHVRKECHKKTHKRKRSESEKHEDDAAFKKRRQCRSRSKEKSRKDREITKEKEIRSRDRSPKYSKYVHDKYKDFDHKSDKYKSRDDRDYKSKDDYRDRDNHRYREDYKYRDESRRYNSRDDFYKDYNDRRVKDRYEEHSRDRSCESETRFDKKKLLEIARKNAIQMMKSGKLSGALTLGPQAQEKVIAAISGGGKTIEELTDFCKSLSKKEELGELSSISATDDSESEDEGLPIRHPFQIKEKTFTINIKNSVPLPTRTNQERSSELRLQFPVSSGQLHRKTESEWVPVSPKKTQATPAPAVTNTLSAPLPIEPPPPVPAPSIPNPVPPVQKPPTLPGPQVFPPVAKPSEQEIASMVTQRLAAMRKLQENPNDPQAMLEMNNAQQGMNTWVESKLPHGQFTGTTGANILSQSQLASGYQAWARKDQLQTAAPVSGGMGMHLLQKMGWRPGEGLGKEKTGALEPLLLEVKLDKKGVIAKEECKKKAAAVRIPKQTVKTVEGKHPVSLLHEFASKRKLGAPEYVLDFECGPDHMKNFLFKVRVNGIEYKPNVASGNKKDAKAMAATICLQSLGLLPS